MTDQETIDQLRARVAELEKDLTHERSVHQSNVESLQSERDSLRARVAEETAIVDRVWKALGISNYEQAKPFAIDEHVANLRSALAQAEADTKRLDNQDLYRIEKYHGAWHVETIDGFERAAKTLREAIDAALSEQEGEAQ